MKITGHQILSAIEEQFSMVTTPDHAGLVKITLGIIAPKLVLEEYKEVDALLESVDDSTFFAFDVVARAIVDAIRSLADKMILGWNTTYTTQRDIDEYIAMSLTIRYLLIGWINHVGLNR